MYGKNSNSQNNKESTNSGMDRNDDAIHNDNYCTNCDNNLVHDSCNESSYYFQNKKDHYIHNRFLQNNCSYREVDEIFLFYKNNHYNNRPHSVH